MTSMAPTSPVQKRADHRPAALLVALLCLVAGGMAQAKQSDRSKPVQVSARSADATAQPNGVSHIKGDVVITQGTLKATSNLATIHFDAQSQVDRVVLTGQAHIQQMDDHGNLMTGQAESIDYNVPGGIAILTGHAHIDQKGRGSASGDKLVYDTKNSTMTAQSHGDNRVHLIFSATQKPPANASHAAASSSAASTSADQPAPASTAPAPAKTGN